MQGSVRQEMIISTMPAPDGMIAVRISDTGTGIDATTMEKLFQPFHTTKKQGMGVGLSICRTIVESHGGTITVEPNAGGGTTFCFTLRGVSDAESDT
jgi:two-component system sensor kinase FixL